MRVVADITVTVAALVVAMKMAWNLCLPIAIELEARRSDAGRTRNWSLAFPVDVLFLVAMALGLTMGGALPLRTVGRWTVFVGSVALDVLSYSPLLLFGWIQARRRRRRLRLAGGQATPHGDQEPNEGQR